MYKAKQKALLFLSQNGHQMCGIERLHLN